MASMVQCSIRTLFMYVSNMLTTCRGFRSSLGAHVIVMAGKTLPQSVAYSKNDLFRDKSNKVYRVALYPTKQATQLLTAGHRHPSSKVS
jgi:hypothetical protein